MLFYFLGLLYIFITGISWVIGSK